MQRLALLMHRLALLMHRLALLKQGNANTNLLDALVFAGARELIQGY
jgi:hypothetical protein